MIYKGNAICPKDGEFSWTILEPEKGKVIVSRDITTNIKDYAIKLNLVIARCPKCGKFIEIRNYDFKSNAITK